MVRRWRSASLAALVLCACDASGASLTVDLRTDLSPNDEFVSVRTEVSTTPFAGASAVDALSDEAFVAGNADYVTGRRIARFDDVATGPVFVRVSLIDARGAVAVERVTTVTLRGRVSIVVAVTRACRGVVCPDPTGDPDATSCAAGRCVPPTCTPETPEFCGEPECTTHGDCARAAACASSVCAAGECFEVGDHARCASDEWCNPEVGCVVREGPTGDAGPACTARETSCRDGLDDDCDGAIDCVDPDCAAATCDDGNACTENDVCGGDGGVCAGSTIVCDDENACTDDACDAATGECAHQANAASCDDGLFCNGADACTGGACAAHAGTTCARFCSETSGACTECESTADCGTPPETTWGACEFADPCATTGTQTGTETRVSCDAGMCTTTTMNPTRACSRPSREGASCGASTRDRCCGGACVDTWSSEAHCGGCGLQCAGGLSCTIVRQGGGAACYRCDFNSQCSGGNTSLATCWSVGTGGAGYCRCQSDAACASGQRCNRPMTGLNVDNHCTY